MPQYSFPFSLADLGVSLFQSTDPNYRLKKIRERKGIKTATPSVQPAEDIAPSAIAPSAIDQMLEQYKENALRAIEGDDSHPP